MYWLRFRICIVGSGFNVKIYGECLGFNLAKVKVGPLGSSKKKKVLLLLNLYNVPVLKLRASVF